MSVSKFTLLSACWRMLLWKW